MVSASRICGADRPPATGVVGVLNTYGNSDACAAPYGKLTGGRNGSGAFSSLNSYANVGTNRDTDWSTVNALHAKIASVPTAPSAIGGLGNALSGYCAAITAAVAAGTPSVDAI